MSADDDEVAYEMRNLEALRQMAQDDIIYPDPSALDGPDLGNDFWSRATVTHAKVAPSFKPTNPKDAVGVRKWRYYSTVSQLVLAEVGVAMLEGAMKYGRHNYRVAGVSASVYFDAAKGHLDQWWEGEDLDHDTGLSHVTKAIASLFVLRDAMINDMLTDDRPPMGRLNDTREHLQKVVDSFFDKYPDPRPAFTITDSQPLIYGAKS